MKRMMKRMVLSVLILMLVYSSMGCSQQTEQSKYSELVDFVVEVEAGRDVRVLQLSDIQIDEESSKPIEENLENRYKKYVREVVEKSKPDLIVITGDNIRGKRDEEGAYFQDLIAFMDSFEIPWAPIFGNHDAECPKGIEWMCDELLGAKHCLFEPGEITGYGNYSVGIMQNNILTRVFYMMDTGGCAGASRASIDGAQMSAAVGFKEAQINWFVDETQNLRRKCPEVNIAVAMHIQPTVFKEAFKKYGFINDATESNPINIDKVGESGDFGYLGADMKTPWDRNYVIFDTLVSAGVDLMLSGHEHANSGSAIYQGVRMQYGQKSSTYDRANYMTDTGKIVTSVDPLAGEPIVGGTLMYFADETGEWTDGKIILWGQ